MTILAALQQIVESIRNWANNKFLKKTDVDTALSSTSTNPVQNKVVDSKISELQGQIQNIDVSGQIQQEINKLDVSGKIQQAIGNIDYPVDSVNGKTGAVTLTASDVGALPSTTKIPGALSDLTSDTTHRTVTDAEKTAWNAKSTFSGNYNDLTNRPTIPSIAGLATETYVNNKVAGLVDSAPETLDTLNELSKALGNDPNFATTIAMQIGNIDKKVGNDTVSTQISNAINDATAQDFGIYVQGTTPSNAVDGDIWIDTANDPIAMEIDAPVQSVNGKTGSVIITADDIGAQVAGDYVLRSNIGSLAAKNTVSKSDLDSSVQSSLNKADSALQSFTEKDPTVPSWAKAATKPTYTKSEVGLSNVDNVKQYSVNNPPPYPVTSVNGKTGALTLSASDVGALSSSTKIPSKTSELTNDSGFIKSYTETDPTVPSWAKASTKPTYTKSEVGLGNVDNVKQYSASNPPPYPVTSVNGKTGAVTISALPAVTTSDNGKVLMVVNGTWKAVDLNMSIDANGVVSI